MELTVSFLYVFVAALGWQVSKGWVVEDSRLMAAVLWPLTLLALVILGLLLLPVLLLAFAGYLNAWRVDYRPRRRAPSEAFSRVTL